MKLFKLKLMFPAEEEKSRTVKKRMPLGKKILLIYGGVVALCLVTIGGLLILNGLLGASVNVPEPIKQKVKSSIYLPGMLPGNYKINEESFNYVDEDSVLLFEASDGVSGKLIFSEQAKPKDFDFARVHQGNFEEPKTLSNVPFPSVWGKSGDGRYVLSVVTDDTWIMMVASGTLTENDMSIVAKNMQKR